MKKSIIAVLLLVVLAAAVLFLIPKAPAQQSTADAPPEKSRAQQLAESMTLEEKVGQMFLVCVSESTISTEDIAAYGPGGYLFFADFFQSRTKDAASSDIAAFQEASSVPMLMAVDEEGGTVVRVSKFPAYRSRPFSSPMELYQEGGLERVLEDTEKKDQLLLSLGLNVNLAPVCDMTEDPDAFIYSRTLGQNTEITSEYITAVVKAMKAAGMGSALKHFPGYGGNVDTHTGIATDTRSYEDFEKKDFLPFKAGIQAGAPCILVSHNIVTCMDSEKPASLSPAVHEILREDLNFDGVILTDDLIMDGVQGYSGKDNIAVAAVKAGNDLLCTYAYKEQLPAVVKAIKNGEISEKQITDSVIRILQWKDDLGLLK